MFYVFRNIILAVFSCFLLTQFSFASVILNSSRVVYSADEREANIKVSNVGSLPVILQSWIDNGEVNQDPSLVKTPFLLMPALTRVESGQGHTLRLVYTGEPLPDKHESVFYLNVLEIPPKNTTAQDSNSIQLAFRTRIKVFFRPKGLSGSADEAPSKLIWSLKQDKRGWILNCSNPSAYHVSMSDISIVEKGIATKVGEGMIAPGQQLDVVLGTRPSENTQIEYTNVDDYGALRVGRSTLKF
ncbi:molecular chaperone [Pseudomonas sp. KCJK9016]|uniref:fimbrial biogenesis chaperone n=1 Tax=Pseudomonas sp. KCJK9016 TaxID=3344556 RepID=UPI003905B1DC